MIILDTTFGPVGVALDFDADRDQKIAHWGHPDGFEWAPLDVNGTAVEAAGELALTGGTWQAEEPDDTLVRDDDSPPPARRNAITSAVVDALNAAVPDGDGALDEARRLVIRRKIREARLKIREVNGYVRDALRPQVAALREQLQPPPVVAGLLVTIGNALADGTVFTDVPAVGAGQEIHVVAANLPDADLTDGRWYLTPDAEQGFVIRQPVLTGGVGGEPAVWRIPLPEGAA